MPENYQPLKVRFHVEHSDTMIPLWMDRLAAASIVPPAAAPEQWAGHIALIREWNKVSGLVSLGDADRLETLHLPDAVSLAPILHHYHADTGVLLDIGSGGGFPAIPLAILFPEWSVTLVERSQKKADFLRRVVSVLRLPGVTVLEGEFPGIAAGITADILTARAVEQPVKVHKAMARWMTPGACFIGQTEPTGAFTETMFHVEPWRDDWDSAGLRRGSVWIARRRAE